MLPKAISPNALDELHRLFPKERILRGGAHTAAFESDGLTAFSARPQLIVVVESRQEIIEAVRWCHRNRIPFVARGSGTSLSGGAMPVADGIVIALNKCNRILSLDPDQRLAVVEPGTINLHVSQAAHQYGLSYAPDPSSGAVCTIGGNVAFNSGGAHCLKYGMTSNHVLAMEAVLADGTIVRMGSESVESIGPDMTGLFCGSEGLFGIATEITLRLLPIPESFHTVLVGYDSLQLAGDAVSAIIDSGLLPGAVEIMDAVSIEAAEAAVACHYPKGVAAVLIVELEGPREKLEVDQQRLADAIETTSPAVVHVAQNEDERANIWKGRKSVFSAAGRLSPDFMVQDGVVPRTRLGEALIAIEEISQRSGIRIANVFHAGDGNLHPLIMYDGTIDGDLHRAEAVAGEILRMCISMDGSITGEHGVGMEKREYLPEMYDQPSIELMHRIRDAMDPERIANPGKMFLEEYS